MTHVSQHWNNIRSSRAACRPGACWRGMLIAAALALTLHRCGLGCPTAAEPGLVASSQKQVTAAPVSKPSDRKVLLFSIDGLRPDVALRADAPSVRGLMREGAFTFWAQTTALSVTLPSHTSMLTGVACQA